MTSIDQIITNSTAITTSKTGTGKNADGTSVDDSSTMDNNDFLQLMIAQLKYQDPSNPVDSSQFMNQTAMFSQMEATQAMQKSQASLLTSQQSLTGTSLLGSKVTAASSTGGDDIVGVVTSVKLGSDGPILKIGDMEVALSSVKEVSSS